MLNLVQLIGASPPKMRALNWSASTLQFQIDCLLVGANPDEPAAVEVTPSGIGLHWEKLDVDLTVPSLLRGAYGTKAWMVKLKHKQEAA